MSLASAQNSWINTNSSSPSVSSIPGVSVVKLLATTLTNNQGFLVATPSTLTTLRISLTTIYVVLTPLTNYVAYISGIVIHTSLTPISGTLTLTFGNSNNVILDTPPSTLTIPVPGESYGYSVPFVLMFPFSTGTVVNTTPFTIELNGSTTADTSSDFSVQNMTAYLISQSQI